MTSTLKTDITAKSDLQERNLSGVIESLGAEDGANLQRETGCFSPRVC